MGFVVLLLMSGMGFYWFQIRRKVQKMSEERKLSEAMKRVQLRNQEFPERYAKMVQRQARAEQRKIRASLRKEARER